MVHACSMSRKPDSYQYMIEVTIVITYTQYNNKIRGKLYYLYCKKIKTIPIL